MKFAYRDNLNRVSASGDLAEILSEAEVKSLKQYYANLEGDIFILCNDDFKYMELWMKQCGIDKQRQQEIEDGLRAHKITCDCQFELGISD